MAKGRAAPVQQSAKVTGYLKGNLGNQLFIYAAARQIQEKHMGGTAACRMIFDAERSVKINRLENFRLNDSVSYQAAPLPLRQKIARHFLYSRYWEEGQQYQHPEDMMGYTLKNRKRLQKFGLVLGEDCFVPIEEKLPNDVYLDGYFQSERFFPDIRSQLLHEIVPKEPPLPKNEEIIRQLSTTESVCLTARMGFFQQDPMYNVCTIQYYRDAIELMKWLHPNCRFFLFSDNVEAAKANLPLPEDTVCEQGNDPDYEKLRVMAHSKHFIISNSSFSWWVQYLGIAPDKTVIAPNHWYTIPIPCDVFQQNWIMLPTE